MAVTPALPVCATVSLEPSSAGRGSFTDTEFPLGYATSRTLERVLSSFGLWASVPLRFEAALDVAQGGVLFALPLLLSEGLLEHTRKHYSLPPGYRKCVASAPAAEAPPGIPPPREPSARHPKGVRLWDYKVGHRPDGDNTPSPFPLLPRHF